MMNPAVKRSIKIISGTIGVLFLLLVAVVGYVLVKIPSVGEMRKYIKEDKKQTVATEATTAKAGEVQAAPEKAEVSNTETVDLVESSADKKAAKERVFDVIANDLANKEKPLISVCKNLKNSQQSGYLKDSKNANAVYFMSSIGANKVEEQDLAIETGAPFLRYFFRAPGVDYLVDTLLKIPEDATKEELSSLVQKAELLANMYKAYNYLKSNKEELNSVVQRSHDLNVLVKAAAARPEIADDPAVQGFCQQMEDNLNNLGSYNADEQKQEIKKLLDTFHIDPKSIDYDPNYKANVDITMGDNNLSMNDKWITEFFAEDIKKAQSAKADGEHTSSTN